MASIKKEMIVIAKYTVKANGAVIYRMRSNVPNKIGRIEGLDQVERDGQWFDVYMVSSDGETVSGCETSGEQCRGSKYRGTCCHRKHAQKLLDAVKVVAPVVAVEETPVIETPAQPVVEIANSSEGIASAVKSAELPEEACHVETTPAVAIEEYRMSDALYAKLSATAPVEPKPTYRIITAPGPKKERRDFVGELMQKAEDKRNLLAECREIKARKRSEDLGLKGNFGNRGFQLMR